VALPRWWEKRWQAAEGGLQAGKEERNYGR
jgi:hypothetical protein